MGRTTAMTAGSIDTAYAAILFQVYGFAAGLAPAHPWKVRFLGLPLAAFLLLSHPFVKVASLGESLFLLLVNVLGAPFVKTLTLKRASENMRRLGKQIVGVILSPLLAVFVSVAAASAVMVDPIKATARFSRTCQSHPSQSRN